MSQIKLIPGNHGKDCPGNGELYDAQGNRMECLCDECNYMLCCVEEHWREACVICREHDCKWNPAYKR